MDKTDDEGKVFGAVVGIGLLIWAIGALLAYTTSFYGYLSSLSDTPWWLVPVVTLLALVLGFACYGLYLQAGTERPRLKISRVSQSLDKTFFKALSLLLTIGTGTAVAYHMGDSPALLRFESNEAMQRYKYAQVVKQAEVARIDRLANEPALAEKETMKLARLERERKEKAREAQKKREEEEAQHKARQRKTRIEEEQRAEASRIERQRQHELHQQQDKLLDEQLARYGNRKSIPYYQAAEAITERLGLPSYSYRNERDSLKGQYQQAIQVAKKNYGSPQDGRFYRACYLAAMAIDWPEKAIDHLTLLETNLPGEASWVAFRKSVLQYSNFGQIDKALALIDTSLQAEPDNPVYHNLKGMYLWHIGKLKESAAEFHTGDHYLNEELLYYLMNDAKSAFTLAARKLDSPHNTRYAFYRLWFYAVASPKSHQKLAAIEAETGLFADASFSNAIELVRLHVNKLGLLQQTRHDRNVYEKFCQENNLRPGILEVIWAASLAAEGNYAAARIYAERAVALIADEAKEEVGQHVELYHRKQPLRTKEHTRFLFQYGMKVQLPNLSIPPVLAEHR